MPSLWSSTDLVVKEDKDSNVVVVGGVVVGSAKMSSTQGRCSGPRLCSDAPRGINVDMALLLLQNRKQKKQKKQKQKKQKQKKLTMKLTKK
jgi:7-keto-8-aminopelargonate synthetase-like enzyme